MRRTDHLFDLIQIVRDGRLHRAADLASRLGVSLRTIYRDMETLAAAGLPIEGERGMGYVCRERVTLPPLNLTTDEFDALRLATGLVARTGNARLAGAARTLAAKVEAAARPVPVMAYPLADAPMEGAGHIAPLRLAIDESRRVRLGSTRRDGTASTRLLRPLELETWTGTWTLTAWCELRGDFRVFRLDRIDVLTLTKDRFRDEPGRCLRDYLALMGEGLGCGP
jgi:predicted DNA-binding transcriptional regulator YafY